MTREEAIKVFDDYFSTGRVNGTECRLYFPCNIDVVETALGMAISALREQEEKDPCEWCFHFANDRQYLASQGNGMYKEAIFEFCPMCGRRLEEV